MNTTTISADSSKDPLYKVSLNGEERIVPKSKAMEAGDELHAKHGGVPTMEPLSAEEAAKQQTEPAPPSNIDDPLGYVYGGKSDAQLDDAPPPVVQVKAGDIDPKAKARIDALQAELRAGGVTGIGFKGEGGDGDQYYANGTRMLDMGYRTQDQRKIEHDNSLPAVQAATGLAQCVIAEHREDRLCTAREFANAIATNGKLTVFGKQLTEQAIRGLMARIKSPALGYLLGVRDRIAAEVKKQEENRNPFYMMGDRNSLAQVLRYECLRFGDVELKLRTRNSTNNDIFAIVSPKFAPADAPEVIAQIVDQLPAEAKGTWTYHPESTTWELRASVWTPTPVEEQAVGEPFSGFVSFRARDNGTMRFRGGGGIDVLRCLNASVYVAEGASTDRVHMGKVLYDIKEMMASATNAISILCKAWGKNRDIEVPLPKDEDDRPVPLEVAMPGFWRALLTDRKSELAQVLPGRTETHVAGLTRSFFAERRDENRLVRSDFGQAWTRYIQDLPIPDQRGGETAIADWLMSERTKVRCELKDEE